MTNDNGKLCPSNVLDCPKVCELNYWCSQFVVEARQEDGNLYPARTLSNLLQVRTAIAGNLMPLARTLGTVRILFSKN